VLLLIPRGRLFRLDPFGLKPLEYDEEKRGLFAKLIDEIQYFVCSANALPDSKSFMDSVMAAGPEDLVSLYHEMIQVILRDGSLDKLGYPLWSPFIRYPYDANNERITAE